MKVTLPNTILIVSWSHIKFNKHDHVTYGGRISQKRLPLSHKTTCTIKEYKNDQYEKDKDTPSRVLRESAFCSTKDAFERKKGRKISLTKTLEYLPTQIRKEVWKQYEKEIGW
jgi:hypothetical protein